MTRAGRLAVAVVAAGGVAAFFLLPVGEWTLRLVARVRGAGVTGALSRTIHPYPTQAEVWKRLGDAHQRSRLTPRIRSIFERFFRWTR